MRTSKLTVKSNSKKISVNSQVKFWFLQPPRLTSLVKMVKNIANDFVAIVAKLHLVTKNPTAIGINTIPCMNVLRAFNPNLTSFYVFMYILHKYINLSNHSQNDEILHTNIQSWLSYNIFLFNINSINLMSNTYYAYNKVCVLHKNVIWL